MRRIQIITLFIIIANLLQAQSYVPFPETNVSWIVKHAGVYCPNNPLHLCEEYEYTFGNDTLIGSHTYKPMIKRGYQYDANLVPTYFSDQAGYFRQDINAKQVFYWHPDSLQESMLYDFNILPGDTVDGLYNTKWSNGEIVVDSVDTVLMAGLSRTRYFLSGTNAGAQVLIEGMGSNAGLIEQLYQFEDNFWITSFCVNGFTLFPDTGMPCNHLIGLESMGLDQTVKIYPNPTDDVLYLENVSQDITNFEISNNNGIVVLEGRCTGDNRKTIQLHGIPAGIYILKLFSGEGHTKTHKVLISR